MSLVRGIVVHTWPARGIRKAGGLILKTHQMFSVYSAPKEIKNATITGHFGFMS